MERHEDPPVAPPVLRAVTAPAAGNEDAREPVALPVAAAPATPGSAAVIPVAERAMSAVANAAAELWLHPDRLLHSLWHGKPGSMAEHMAYLKSAAWVPEEMTGKPRAFLVAAGIAYQLIVAWPLMAAAKAVGAAAPHPLCMLALVVLVILLIVLL